MSIIDGKSLAQDIYDETRALVDAFESAPKLAIITCDPNFETKKYLELKRRKARAVGIELTILELVADATTADLIRSVTAVAELVDGIVVQLPLPRHIDREEVLANIPTDKDPDCFSGAGMVLPPVVGAIDEISSRYKVEWSNASVAVLGHGRLVGAPASTYATDKGAEVTILTEDSQDTKTVLQNADIIIAGAGQPNVVAPDMVKDGVVIFDAATSEDDGELAGDVRQEVAEKASVFTPVPGGIGPITVAILLRNLAILTAHRLNT